MTRIGRRFRFWYSQGQQGVFERDAVDFVKRRDLMGFLLHYWPFGSDIVREYQRSRFWPFQGQRSLFEGDRATLADWNHSEGNNSNRC